MPRALALLFLIAMPFARAETLRFYGYAHDLDSGQYLYTEVHRQELDGDRWTGGTIRYFDAEGRELGFKTLDFSADPFVPVYRFDLRAGHYSEGIDSVGADIGMYRRQEGDDEMRRASVPKQDPVTADSGFHAFLRANMGRLADGKTVNFHFAVAGELDQFKFRAKKTGDTTFEGKPAITLTVEPDSFLRLLAAPLQLVYEPRERKLLEYRGVSNVHDPATGKPYNVRIDYYTSKPADAPSKLPPLE